MTEGKDFDQLRYWIEKTLERHESDLTKLWTHVADLQKIQNERTKTVEDWEEFQKDRMKDKKSNAVNATVIAGIVTALLEVIQRLVG